MRYNPATDNARDIDAIAAECRAATLAQPQPREHRTTNASLLAAYSNSLRAGGSVSRHFYEFLQLVTAMDVAEAMGNSAERRRLQAQLLAGRF